MAKAFAGKIDVLDLALRLPVIALFSVLALFRLMSFLHHLEAELTGATALRLATDLAWLLFLVLVVLLTTIRLKPVRHSTSMVPNLAALAGSFLSLGMVALPPADLPVAARIGATGMMLVGGMLSFYTISWLGRSFSLMPEARSLVTSGPYGIIRHPLYVCEEISILGAALLVSSWGALALVVTQWLCQLWRMRLEERVLSETFPDEYPAYAQRVPRLVPWRRMPAGSPHFP